MPAYELAPRVYKCGRSAGYLQFRLGELRALAEPCVANGHLVAWA